MKHRRTTSLSPAPSNLQFPGTAPLTKPLTVPSGIPNRRIPWPCYILQEDEPNNFQAIRYCYQQFYKDYYHKLQMIQNN